MMIKVSHYLINYCNSKVGLSLVGVMGAYLFYIQMAVVRFHHEVLILVHTIPHRKGSVIGVIEQVVSSAVCKIVLILVRFDSY